MNNENSYPAGPYLVWIGCVLSSFLCCMVFYYGLTDNHGGLYTWQISLAISHPGTCEGAVAVPAAVPGEHSDLSASGLSAGHDPVSSRNRQPGQLHCVHLHPSDVDELSCCAPWHGRRFWKKTA